MSDQESLNMFKRVAIIGVGLLGGSFALAMRQQRLAKQIVGVCRRTETAALAKQLGVVDHSYPSAEEAVAGADLVLLATPMLTMPAVLAEIAPHIADDCIVTDVGSVKGCLVELLQAEHPELLSNFVFAHPIAGGETSGVAAARADLFAGKHLILTDVQHTQAHCVETVRSLWKQFGANVVDMSAQEHDHIFAYTSHLPHVIAYTLVNNLHHQANNQQLFNFASAGFYDFTRIASSDPIMWRDICLSNKTEVLNSIEQFSAQLTALTTAIEANDHEQLAAIFSDAKMARDEGLIAKKS